MHFLNIPEIQALGRFCCVDGSVFPAIITMTWAVYQQKRNAIKLHLAFELNRMIPTQFLSTEANASERNMLRRMLEAGVTYIADRGYVCFKLFHDIGASQAHFIIRATSNLIYDVYETFAVDLPEHWSLFFKSVEDRRIRFTNDVHQHDYRLVSFMAMGEYFSLITDRFDLRTSEIITLYAYRWQVGVSREGHMNPVGESPTEVGSSSLVAWEAPWREIKTVKPSDTMLLGSMRKTPGCNVQ
jgi:hypothetical protein